MKQYFKGLSTIETYPDHVGVVGLALVGSPYRIIKERPTLEGVIGDYLPKARVPSNQTDKPDGMFVVK